MTGPWGRVPDQDATHSTDDAVQVALRDAGWYKLYHGQRAGWRCMVRGSDGKLCLNPSGKRTGMTNVSLVVRHLMLDHWEQVGDVVRTTLRATHPERYVDERLDEQIARFETRLAGLNADVVNIASHQSRDLERLAQQLVATPRSLIVDDPTTSNWWMRLGTLLAAREQTIRTLSGLMYARDSSVPEEWKL